MVRHSHDMDGYLRGIHNKSGFPTKNALQTHRPVSSLHAAPTPQTTPSQRCRQRPATHVSGSSHGIPGPQTSLRHAPPGNGLPTIPSGQTHVGPVFDIIH